MSSSSSSSSSLSRPRGGLSACRCLSLPRPPPWPGPLVPGFSATSLGFLLVAPLVLGLLQLDEPLDLLAALEVVALGAVDLAVLFVGVVPLVGDRRSLAVGASGNLLAGATSLGFVGGTFIVGLLNNQHFLVLLLPVVLP